MQQTAYKCLECGHFTISQYDGERCAKCEGQIRPVGHATVRRDKSLTVNVSVKDTDLFKRIIQAIHSVLENKDTPEWIRKKLTDAIREKND